MIFTINRAVFVKLLKEFVQRGLLKVLNPDQGTRLRCYGKPDGTPEIKLFSEFKGKQTGGPR